jgi:uncharacterized membrane protein YhaH (DUF805 family)
MRWLLRAWQNSMTFRGRARRREYWGLLLLTVLLTVGLLAIGVILTESKPGAIAPSMNLLYMALLLTSAVLLAPVGARRLHDTGRSGWWQLLTLIPYVGGPIVLILFVLPGEPDDNLYGPAPAAAANDDGRPTLSDPLMAERQRLTERFGLPREVSSHPPALTAPMQAIDEPSIAEFLSRQPWRIIAGFVALELLGVSGIGAWYAQRLGFSYSWYTPLAGLICVGAGYYTARSGGSPALAGAAVAVLDILAWVAFGGFGPLPPLPDSSAAGILSMLVFAAIPAMLAAMVGGWLAARRVTSIMA